MLEELADWCPRVVHVVRQASLVPHCAMQSARRPHADWSSSEVALASHSLTNGSCANAVEANIAIKNIETARVLECSQ